MTPTNATAAAQAATPLTPRPGNADLRKPKASPAPNSEFYRLADGGRAGRYRSWRPV